MKILMISSVPLAAPWNGADKNMARAFVLYDDAHQFIVHTSEDENWDTQKVQPVRSRWANPMPTALQKLRTYLYLLRYSRQADVVHLVTSYAHPSWLSIRLFQLWKALYRRPLIHTIPSIGDGAIQRSHYFADQTLVLSEYTRQRLTAAGVPNVKKVNPIVEAQRIEPRSSPEALNQQLGLGDRAVLYPAHYGHQSGISEMIQAFARLPQSLEDATLVLACRTHVGQDAQAEAEKVMDMARAAGIEARVRLLPRVEDMGALIAACAVTALVPSHLASKMDLPMVILEALLLGKPVIVTDIKPMSEVLMGDCGEAVPFGDIAALQAALTTLLADENRREKGETGRKLVKAACSPQDVIADYAAIYQQVRSQ